MESGGSPLLYDSEQIQPFLRKLPCLCSSWTLDIRADCFGFPSKPQQTKLCPLPAAVFLPPNPHLSLASLRSPMLASRKGFFGMGEENQLIGSLKKNSPILFFFNKGFVGPDFFCSRLTCRAPRAPHGTCCCCSKRFCCLTADAPSGRLPGGRFAAAQLPAKKLGFLQSKNVNQTKPVTRNSSVIGGRQNGCRFQAAAFKLLFPHCCAVCLPPQFCAAATHLFLLRR